ncbi:MAG: hypothetical protein RMX35_30410 [Nostoc sp. DcaGUA01]|nr:hypothetical protein [Nostoc sp. DcaGUA01]
MDCSSSHRSWVAGLEHRNHVPLPEQVISTHVAATLALAPIE